MIFPFEETIYRDAGVPVDFVGHPLVDVVRADDDARRNSPRGTASTPERPIVALLARQPPQTKSRRIIRAFSKRANSWRGNGKTLRRDPVRPRRRAQSACRTFRTPTALARRSRSSASKAAPTTRWPPPIAPSSPAAPRPSKQRCSARRWSSSTASRRITALILRRMIRTPFISMVNLIAGRRVVPELIQDDFTPAAVEAEVRHLLESPEAPRRDESRPRRSSREAGPGRRDRTGRGCFCADAVEPFCPGQLKSGYLVS